MCMLKKMLRIYIILTAHTLYSYRRIILTGGPGVGKSTVISMLNNQGYQVSPEAYETLYNKLGDETIAAMDASLFRNMLMEGQLKIEKNLIPAQPAFLDRSTLDVIFYGQYFGIPVSPKLAQDAQNNRYDAVLFLEELPKEHYQKSKFRTESSEESHTIHEFLKQKYQQKAKELNIPFIAIPYAAPEQRVQRILDALQDYYFYADIIDCFAGKNNKYTIKDFFGPVKLITIQSDDQKMPPYRFFGIHKDLQQNVDFKAFKQKLTSFLNIQPQKCIQLIGDSNQFTTQGSAEAAAFIKGELDRSRGLIEYGFTGYIRGRDFDVNSLVSNYIDNNPDQAYRVLGNILGHTHLALRHWGTFGSSLVRNFMVVYNDSGMQDAPVYDTHGIKVKGFTTFGDDVIISDYIFQASDGDYFICLEGGAQSFEQCTHALQSNIPILCMLDLRKSENRNMFSATLFMSLIDKEFVNDVPPTHERVLEIYKFYINGLSSMFNEKKPDFLTKKEIFERALKKFIDGGLYKKIHKLCTFLTIEEPVVVINYPRHAAKMIAEINEYVYPGYIDSFGGLPDRPWSEDEKRTFIAEKILANPKAYRMMEAEFYLLNEWHKLKGLDSTIVLAKKILAKVNAELKKLPPTELQPVLKSPAANSPQERFITLKMIQSDMQRFIDAQEAK